MKANADKCHLLAAGNYEVSANINEFEIERTSIGLIWTSKNKDP